MKYAKADWPKISGLSQACGNLSRDITSPLGHNCPAAHREGSEPVRIDFGHDDPFRAAAGDLSGRSEHQTELRRVGAGGVEICVVARASRSFGNSPSATEMLFSSPLRHTVSFTVEPDAIAPICLARSWAYLTAWPLTAVITSPEITPAFAAGLPACGSVTSAPSSQ